MVAELFKVVDIVIFCCSLAKISMVAEQRMLDLDEDTSCSLAKISMVAEQAILQQYYPTSCSLAKISMVAEPQNI